MNTMYIDDNSLKALNIFHKISHPSGFKQGLKNNIKEGPSVYSEHFTCLHNIYFIRNFQVLSSVFKV